MFKRIKRFITNWWHSLFNIYLEDEHTAHVVYNRKRNEAINPEVLEVLEWAEKYRHGYVIESTVDCNQVVELLSSPEAQEMVLKHIRDTTNRPFKDCPVLLDNPEDYH
jgi:hypothetical protein